MTSGQNVASLPSRRIVSVFDNHYCLFKINERKCILMNLFLPHPLYWTRTKPYLLIPGVNRTVTSVCCFTPKCRWCDVWLAAVNCGWLRLLSLKKLVTVFPSGWWISPCVIVNGWFQNGGSIKGSLSGILNPLFLSYWIIYIQVTYCAFGSPSDIYLGINTVFFMHMWFSVEVGLCDCQPLRPTCYTDNEAANTSVTAMSVF